MGSYIHANYLFDNQIPIKGMICLEMIGYYNEAAVMITNTSFYRNAYYNTSKDVLSTIDIQKMSAVIQQLNRTIKTLE